MSVLAGLTGYGGTGKIKRKATNDRLHNCVRAARVAKWILMKDSGLKGLRAYQKQRTKENLSGKKCKRTESEMDQSRELKGGRGYSPRRSSRKRRDSTGLGKPDQRDED